MPGIGKKVSKLFFYPARGDSTQSDGENFFALVDKKLQQFKFFKKCQTYIRDL